MANRKKRKAEYINFLNEIRLSGGYFEIYRIASEEFVLQDMTLWALKYKIPLKRIYLPVEIIPLEYDSSTMTVLQLIKTKVISGRIKKLR